MARQIYFVCSVSSSKHKVLKVSKGKFKNSCLKLQGPGLWYVVWNIIYRSFTKVFQIMLWAIGVSIWCNEKNKKYSPLKPQGLEPKCLAWVIVYWTCTGIVQIMIIGSPHYPPGLVVYWFPFIGLAVKFWFNPGSG